VNGQYFNYDTFYSRAWKTLAEKVTGLKTTPYSTRDTFITRQIEKGKPIAIIAKWVDNSTAIIEKNYLDTAAILSIRPD
jgi:integrase